MNNNPNAMRQAGKKWTAPLCLAAALLSAPWAANAYTITTTQICDAATQACEGSPESDVFKVTIVDDGIGTDTDFTVDWLVPAGTVGTSALPVNLVASSTWTISSFGSGALDLNIVIANDTDLSLLPGTNASILSFGFGVEPDSTASLLSSGTYFDTVTDGQGANQTFPGGFKQIDVCIFTAGCTGGDINTGLAAGASDSLAIQVSPTVGTYSNTIELLFFPLKFQGTWGSFEPAGTPGSDPGSDPGPGIPVPAPLVLIGLGGLLLGWRSRKPR